MAKKRKSRKKAQDLGSSHPLIVVPPAMLSGPNPDFELAARWDKLVEKACKGVENEGPLSLRRSKCDDVKRRRKIAMRKVMDWIGDDRRVNRPTFHGLGEPLPMRTKVLIGGGIALIAVVAMNRRKIAAGAVAVGEKAAEVASELKGKLLSALNAAERKILRTVVPEKGEQFIDMVFETAPKYGLNPVFMLSFLAVESGFKLGPTEHGDGIPRCLGWSNMPKSLEAWAMQLPGMKKDGPGEYKNANGDVVKCPTNVMRPGPQKTGGWGIGPMQIDWIANHKFFQDTPNAMTAQGQIEKACKLVTGNIERIRTAIPNIDDATLFKAVIASYNAGPGYLPTAKDKDGAGAIGAIAIGKPLENVTAAKWYIPRVAENMKKLSTLFGGSPTSMFTK